MTGLCYRPGSTSTPFVDRGRKRGREKEGGVKREERARERERERLRESETMHQVWLCLDAAFDDPACPRGPGDLACYVYLVAQRAFAFFGANSYLHLV